MNSWFWTTYHIHLSPKHKGFEFFLSLVLCMKGNGQDEMGFFLNYFKWSFVILHPRSYLHMVGTFLIICISVFVFKWSLPLLVYQPMIYNRPLKVILFFFVKLLIFVFVLFPIKYFLCNLTVGSHLIQITNVSYFHLMIIGINIPVSFNCHFAQRYNSQKLTVASLISESLPKWRPLNERKHQSLRWPSSCLSN